MNFFFLSVQREKESERGKTAAKSFALQQRGLWGLCSFFVCVCVWGDRLSFFVGATSMGAQLSRAAVKAEAVAEKPGEAVASSPNKTNGQVNYILSSSFHRIHLGGWWGREGGRGYLSGCAVRVQIRA